MTEKKKKNRYRLPFAADSAICTCQIPSLDVFFYSSALTFKKKRKKDAFMQFFLHPSGIKLLKFAPHHVERFSNLLLSLFHQILVHDNVHVNAFANALSETITKSNSQREHLPGKSQWEANRFAPASTKTNRPAAGPELPQQDVGRLAANWEHCQKSLWLFFTGKKKSAVLCTNNVSPLIL